jgi:hypothetical protein
LVVVAGDVFRVVALAQPERGPCRSGRNSTGLVPGREKRGEGVDLVGIGVEITVGTGESGQPALDQRNTLLAPTAAGRHQVESQRQHLPYSCVDQIRQRAPDRRVWIVGPGLHRPAHRRQRGDEAVHDGQVDPPQDRTPPGEPPGHRRAPGWAGPARARRARVRTAPARPGSPPTPRSEPRRPARRGPRTQPPPPPRSPGPSRPAVRAETCPAAVVWPGPALASPAARTAARGAATPPRLPCRRGEQPASHRRRRKDAGGCS